MLPSESQGNIRQRVSIGQPLRAQVRDTLAGAVGRAVAQFRPGTPIWEHDWDVLCVLDACRLDLMREHAASASHEFLPDSGDIDATWSVGSQSAEWMDRTFAAEFRDEMVRTAYVTGNPFSAQNGDYVATVSEDVLPLGSNDFGYFHETWRNGWEDGAISTIPPRPLTDAAIGVWRNRAALDIERVIVHYMQPHAPFRSRPEWFFGEADTETWGQIAESSDDDANGNDDTNEESAALATLDEDELAALAAFADADDEVRDPWMRVRDGDLPFGEFWEAYRDNLAWVLDDIGLLLENCDAHVALTSDHGNGTGEWGVWSHPPGTPLPALRRVPWVDLDGHDTESHQPGLPDATGQSVLDDSDRSATDATVEDRLADLGYR